MQEENVELQYLVGLSSATSPTTETVPNLLENRRPILKRFPYLGLVLATLSSFFFSLCSVIVKSLENINPIQLVMFRFLGVLMPTIPILVYTEQPVFPKGSRLLLVVRSIVGTLGMMSGFFAFRHLPLAEASVIIFSLPVFVTILSKKFLKEPSGLIDPIAAVLALVGITVIMHRYYDVVNPIHTKTKEELFYDIACGFAFTSTFLLAISYVLLRLLKGLHFSVTMTNFSVIAIIQSIIFLYFFGTICMPVCGKERFLVVCLAMFSYLGQFLVTTALQMEQAGPVAIARSADIVFAFIWQLLFFNEMPTIYCFIGGCLVFLAIVLVGVRKWAIALPPESQLRAKLSIFYR